MNPFVVMGGYAAQALWLAVLGVSLVRKPRSAAYASSGVFARAG